MKLRRRYIPFLSGIFHRLNEDIKNFGVQIAFKHVIEKRGVHFILKGLDPELIKVLSSHRVILVSNHPHEIEPFVLLASLPKRSDAFVVANIMFFNWLSELNKHLIPVHVRHRLGKAERFRLRARLFWLLPLANKNISYAKGHKENITNINNASKKIDAGGMVIIFPGVDQKHWFPGVGFLLKHTTTIEPIYMVKVNITGINKLDLFRIIPFLSKLFPPITITFSKAKQVHNLRFRDGKGITMELERDYRKWLNQS